jgi:hypothetical protein
MVKLLFLLATFFISNRIEQSPHPLYISITDMEWNSKEQSIEIVSKIFIDDFETTLKKTTGTNVDLYAAPSDKVKTMILDYFKKRLQITIDGKLYDYNILGYERQKEACWCYFEIMEVTSIKKIAIVNSLLHDFSEKQINLMHAKVGSKVKSYKLSVPNTTVSFDF